MAHGREDSRHAFDAVTDDVASRLASLGWRRRHLEIFFWQETFTLDMGDGITATAELQRSPNLVNHGWPTSIDVNLGVGFEPALGLMPLVGTVAMATLIYYPRTDRSSAHSVELDDEGDAARAARDISAFVATHAVEFAARYPDAATVEAALGRAADVPDEEWQQRRRERHLTMLAAMGRLDDAAALLPAYAEQYAVGAHSRRERRFARQLARRLADMPSPIPPAEDTLAQLPSRQDRLTWPIGPSFAAVRRDARVEHEARDVVRAQAKGKSPDELRRLIAAEYEQRGATITPSLAAMAAEAMATERQPFGRAEATLRGLWLLGSAVTGLVRTFREPNAEDPEWMRPPDRASYEIPASRDRAIAIQVDSGARDWLNRIRSDGRTILRVTGADVWLSRSPRDAEDGIVDAHIGERHVGTLSPKDAGVFGLFFRAARLFDEDLVLRGDLMRTSDGVDILQIPVPDPQHIVAAAAE
jgi:hypothetical protein